MHNFKCFRCSMITAIQGLLESRSRAVVKNLKLESWTFFELDLPARVQWDKCKNLRFTDGNSLLATLRIQNESIEREIEFSSNLVFVFKC